MTHSPPHSAAATSTGALAGLRILDLSRVLAGPWASQILGDLGAEVIKVEHPGRGDDTRAWGPPFVTDGDGPDNSFSAYYLSCNRNKRSVAVDMANFEGAALIRRLAAGSDILIENFKVGGLLKYGLDYGSLKAANPGLVYCSITGFGQDGPYAARGGYDFLIQGMGGLMSTTGLAEGRPGSEPTKIGIPVADLFTGLYATIAIQAALRHRERTGRGQHIDCALLDTATAVLANHGASWMVAGIVARPMGNAHSTVVPYRTFAVSDGHVIVAVGNDSQFRALCGLLDRPDLSDDVRYATNAGRLANRLELEVQIESETIKRSRDKLLSDMVSAGVPGGPINNVDQVFADPQVKARGMVELHETRSGGELAMTRFPARLSDTPATIRCLPPRLGEHTEEILSQILNLSLEEIARLRATGAIAGQE